MRSRLWMVLAWASLVWNCSSSPAVHNPTDSGTSGAGSTGFTIGGVVTGLSGSGLVLQLNDGDDLAVSASGPFAFSQPLSSGDAFTVTVRTQPTMPWQTCSVTAGTGTVANGNVTTVLVSCTTNSYSLNGSVTGLAGSGLVLQNSSAAVSVAPSASGPVPFTLPGVPSGSSYNVTVLTQPQNPTQSCTVSQGSGTVAGADIQNIAVACSTSAFAVGGTVTGLLGSGLTLQDNGADTVMPAGNGPFAFPTDLPSGGTYSVAVVVQPVSPAQICTVGSGSGTVTSAPVTSVVVNCASSYTIGGTVTGLAGTGLVLLDNGGDSITLNSGTSFTFPTPLAAGAMYDVTIATQPTNPSQTCTLSGATGTVAAAPVTSIAINCTTNTYAVEAAVTGLSGSGLTLADNGTDMLTVNGNGTFRFPQPVASGSLYNVTVVTQPSNPTQVCKVTGGAGTIENNDLVVSVACATSTYTIGGTVNGLEGAGLQLQNTGSAGGPETLGVNSNGSYVFTQPVPSGANYAVTVATQPATQTCSVANASGPVTSSDVTDVNVSCSCAAGLGDCDNNAANGCETTLGTNSNCASCGDACNAPNATAQCLSQACAITSCHPGYANCDQFAANGCETNTASDPNNCNGCGNVCPFGPNSTSSCNSSTCQLSCNPGFANCDEAPFNGCEVNTQTDPNNCNGCGNICRLPNATSRCTAGTCSIAACAPNWNDCDHQVANGCEVNTGSDPNNCGSCGRICQLPNAAAGCAGGMCEIAGCNSGHQDCNHLPTDGCETDTMNDPNNCGACGHVCSVNNGVAGCSNGQCTIARCNTGYANCDGNFASGCNINTMSDPNNCGSCGRACSAQCAPNDVATTCTNSVCAITGCASGHSDFDGVCSDGCECSAVGTTGTTCPAGAISLGTLPPLASPSRATANIFPPTLGMSAYYSVTFTGYPNPSYKPQVTLGGSGWVMDITSDCATVISSNTTSWFTTSLPSSNGTVYIRVKYASASQPVCTPFTLTASNG